MEEMMTTWRKFNVNWNISSSLFWICQTLMADRGTLPLLRLPLLPRPSSFSNLNVLRFRNPKSPISRSHILYLSSSRSTVASVKVIPVNRRRFSYKICAVTEKGGVNGRTERGKRGRKQRELWEVLLEDNVEDDGDDGGGSGNLDLWKILEEIVDNVWILKAFKSYGYLLPFILLSLFFSTGPKAFVTSLAVAIGPSLLFYAFQKLIGWDKRRRTSMANQFGMDEEEGEMEIRRSRVRYNSSSVTKGVNRSSARMASRFGGWDELEDGFETVPEEPRKRKPMRKRKKVRREESAEPLLLRLLVSLFPFLSSFINMLK